MSKDRREDKHLWAGREQPESGREALLELGITSISANIDAVEVVRDMVARTKLQLLLKGARRKELKSLKHFV